MASFIKDIEDIRQRATRKLEDGAVTHSYQLDRQQSIGILNEALASEIVCVLRYQHHYFMASGVHGRSVAETFKRHSDQEREHMEEIAERIQQLGGKPDFNPGTLVSRSVSHYVEGESLGQMIREDLIAERVVIDVYQRFIEHFGSKDPTTRTMFEHLKAEEEDHADELSELLYIVDPRSGANRRSDPWVEDGKVEHRAAAGDRRRIRTGGAGAGRTSRGAAASAGRVGDSGALDWRGERASDEPQKQSCRGRRPGGRRICERRRNAGQQPFSQGAGETAEEPGGVRGRPGFKVSRFQSFKVDSKGKI